MVVKDTSIINIVAEFLCYLVTLEGTSKKNKSGLSDNFSEKSASVALSLPESNNLIRDFMKIIEFKNRVRF